MEESSLPVVSAGTISENKIQSLLVESGGAAYLIKHQKAPNDDVFVIVSVDLQPWGGEFGSYRVMMNGPEITVEFFMAQLFPDEDRSVHLAFDIYPRDIGIHRQHLPLRLDRRATGNQEKGGGHQNPRLPWIA